VTFSYLHSQMLPGIRRFRNPCAPALRKRQHEPGGLEQRAAGGRGAVQVKPT
jgi:hypothetical protein